jgi:hypothetical protein
LEISFGVTKAGYHLSPTVSVKHPADGGCNNRGAHPFFERLFDLGDMEHLAACSHLGERR